MSTIRSEMICLKDGESVIDVRGNGFDTVLLLHGKPLVYNWCDCEGSVAQYLIYLSAANPSLSVNLFRAAGEMEPRLDVSLESHLGEFLSLLVPGNYSLNQYITDEPSWMVEFQDQWDIKADSINYYPWEHNLVATQSVQSLNPERILYYENMLKDGKRPLALTISVADGNCELVIDGHHKLAAYQRAKMPSHCLNITRQDAPRITVDEALAYFPEGHPLRKQCKHVKTTCDRTALK